MPVAVALPVADPVTETPEELAVADTKADELELELELEITLDEDPK